jgi:hypothetical protein
MLPNCLLNSCWRVSQSSPLVVSNIINSGQPEAVLYCRCKPETLQPRQVVRNERFRRRGETERKSCNSVSRQWGLRYYPSCFMHEYKIHVSYCGNMKTVISVHQKARIRKVVILTPSTFLREFRNMADVASHWSLWFKPRLVYARLVKDKWYSGMRLFAYPDVPMLSWFHHCSCIVGQVRAASSARQHSFYSFAQDSTHSVVLASSDVSQHLAHIKDTKAYLTFSRGNCCARRCSLCTMWLTLMLLQTNITSRDDIWDGIFESLTSTTATRRNTQL